MDLIQQKLLSESELTPDGIPELLKCDLRIKIGGVNCSLDKMQILYSLNDSIVLSKVKSEKMRKYLFNCFLYVFISKGFNLNKYSEFDSTKILFVEDFSQIYVNGYYFPIIENCVARNSDSIILSVCKYLKNEKSVCDFLINTIPSELFYEGKEKVIKDFFSQIVSNEKKIYMMIYMLSFNTYFKCKYDIICANLHLPNACCEILKYLISMRKFNKIPIFLQNPLRARMNHEEYKELRHCIDVKILTFPLTSDIYKSAEDTYNILLRYEAIDTIRCN